MIETFIEYGVTDIRIESNMGHGLFEINMQKAIADYCRIESGKLSDYEGSEKYTRATELDRLAKVSISGEYSTGQKERRIIDSLVTPMQRHKIVIHPTAIESDLFYMLKHGFGSFDRSWLFQMDKITTDRGSLEHDDRLEALAGVVRMLKNSLSVDVEKEIEKKKEADYKAWLADPMGMGIARETGKGTASRIGQRGGRSRGR